MPSSRNSRRSRIRRVLGKLHRDPSINQGTSVGPGKRSLVNGVSYVTPRSRKVGYKLFHPPHVIQSDLFILWLEVTNNLSKRSRFHSPSQKGHGNAELPGRESHLFLAIYFWAFLRAHLVTGGRPECLSNDELAKCGEHLATGNYLAKP